MTELASGAVSSLLAVVRDEALLLGGVQDDVQFIKEEMESMRSFLAHLARSMPPGGEHDEQVQTWMNQVRLLAQDCHNCIDLYLYSGNPHIHRAKGRLRRHLWWVYWFLRKMLAQHRAAVQLRQLKDRARHVGERRLRYGVEVPSNSAAAGHSPPVATRLMSAASSSAVAGGYAAGGDEEDGDDDHQFAVADHSALFSRTLDDYVKAKLFEWRSGFGPNAGTTMSIAIVASDGELDLDALRRIANENMVFHPDYEYSRGYDLSVFIDIPALHPDFLPVGHKEVLFYILRQLKLQLKSRKQGTDQGGREAGPADFWQVYRQKRRIYFEKKEELHRIKENIEKMKIYAKLDKIKSGVKPGPLKGQEKDMDQKDDPDVYVLLRQLLRSFVPASQQDQLMKNNKDMPPLSASDDIINALAKKLKKHMEADDQVGGEGGVGRVVENEAVQGGEGAAGREVENEAVQEGGGEGGGDIAEERGGRGETLEEEHGVGNDEKEEEEQKIAPIYLHEHQYVQILRQVFPKISSCYNSACKHATDTPLREDQIRQQMIDEPKQEMLLEPQEGKHDKKGPNTEDIFTNIMDQKMNEIKHEFKRQLKIKGLVDNIIRQLKFKCPLFILKIDETVDLPRWEDTRNALSLLGCSADVLIVTTTNDLQQAKEYCYPQSEPIDYSLAGLYYDTVLEITKQQKNEENYVPQIFRNILEQCEPNEFCMKIFTHALSVNPKRSNEELNKLLRILQTSPKSSDVIAKKMFKFSYTDMPKEYKSCLLYLAIFPPGYKIRRSTLIGRWVAEGLIFKEDWPSSVYWANRCFDELINRCFADPAESGAAGKVKSCVVGDQVHGFITKMARKQHILETRLSRHLARHFSIFNDLQLRSSEKINVFFQRLSKSSRVSLIKVLDLEGCQCFGGKNQRYLEDICSKMLLLKYLSLRKTDVTQLPSKINNLRELEVLDIRQTNVPMNATTNVLLLKLKRLLAGNTGRSPRPTLRAEELEYTALQIPHKIEKMVNMEVLSNVKAQSSRDLKDIGKLWQLRKLGVVVDDDSSYLKNLLRAISDLHECLSYLSVTLPRSEATPSNQELPLPLKNPPKLLESLSISGTTQKGHLLPLFIKHVDNNNHLSKITLSCTTLNQNNLDILAKLPKLQLIRLRHIAFTDIESLVFKKEEFKYLKYLLVEGPSFTKISFMAGAACMLEKMALSFTNIESVSGVGRLQKFEEVELSMSSSNKKKNDRLLSSFNNGKQIMAKLTIVSTSPEQGDQETQNMITFNKGKFRKLKLLTVDCSAPTEVVFSSGSVPKLEKIVCPPCTFVTSKVAFSSGSAPKLEKIVWSSSTSLSGIDILPSLKELEFNGDPVPDVVKEAIKKHKSINLKHNKPEIQDPAQGAELENDEDDGARFSLFCWKK